MVRCAFICLMLMAVDAQAEVPAASLSRTSVSAKGRGEAVLTVSNFGRYAIGVESKEGTALQLISRDEGPGAIVGAAGGRSGRLDVILDRGTYKIVTWSAARGSGEARLWVKPFKEMNARVALRETTQVDASLGDAEQRSYWFELPEARAVLLEAAGRNLADLRLWKDGQWLVDALPEKSDAEPVVGRPLTVARIQTRLEPGLYLLTAYGGVAAAWAQDDKSHPFHIRFGIPRLEGAGRVQGAVSAFGVDRYRVPEPADFFRVELPEAAPLTLALRDDKDRPREDAAVTKKSLPPVAELTSEFHGERTVVVSARAGQPYVLQFFKRASSAALPRTETARDYAVTIMSAGIAADNIDATALVTCNDVIVANAGVSLGVDAPYRRRFNLLDTESIYVDVKDAGDYEVDIAGAGVAATYRFEPFLTWRPEHYETPADQASGSKWPLARGLNVLTLSPSKKGVVEVTIRKTSVLGSLLRGFSSIPMTKVREETELAAVHVPANTMCQVYLNQRPSVSEGIVVRELPLPPALIAVRSEAPLPFPPRDGLHFTVLEVAAPVFFDLARGATKTFALRVDKPGLYRVESTGLLATSGTLRSRTVTSLASESENGSGRNFVVAQYLREGDYQLKVAALGASAGHLSVRLVATELEDGGTLVSGVAARAAVNASAATIYHFAVDKTGEYTLSATGTGHALRARLEDGDGWPLASPNSNARFHLRLAKGAYRLLILPEPVATLQVTQLDRAPPPIVRRGHGPHVLAPGTCASLEWREPKKNEKRSADEWRFSLPAAAHTRLSLSAGMQGQLFAENSAGARSEVSSLALGESFSGSLVAGTYVLAAESARLDDHVLYRTCVQTDELVAGETRAGEAPETLAISVGAPGMIELASFGTRDVRATLRDAHGQIVASSDDRVGDWNFAISTVLASGTYALSVEPVGAPSAAYAVTMRAIVEEPRPALSLSDTREMTLADAVLVLPLAAAIDGANLFVAQASASESIGLAVDVRAGDRWLECGHDAGRRAHLEVPVSKGALLRVRVWSPDHREAQAHLQVAALQLRARDERALARGGEGEKVFTPALRVAAYALEHPGVFTIEPHDGTRFASVVAQSAANAEGGVVTVQSKTLFAVSENEDEIFRGARVVAGKARFEVPRRQSVSCDLASSQGPRVVVASSRSGQPGIKLQTREGHGPHVPDAMAVAAQRALAVSLQGAPSEALVWSASSADAIDVSLTAFTFAAPELEALGFGASTPAISSARAFTLPKGAKRVHLVADAHVVAVLSQGGTVLSTHWNGDDPLDETLVSSADRLTLFDLVSEPRQASLEVLPASEPDVLEANAPWLRHFTDSGTARLAIAASSAAHVVTVQGASAAAVFLGADGSVGRGDTLTVPGAGGVWLVPHTAGWLAAWSGDANRGLWREEKTSLVKVSASTRVALAGTQARVELSAPTPTVFHLRADAAVIAQVLRSGASAVTALHPTALSLDLYVSDAPVTVALASLAHTALPSTLDVTTTSVAPLGEGIGPSLVLGAGQSRTYAFTVVKEGAVGIGVRTNADALEVTLADTRGAVIGAGTAQMPTLKAGVYLLSLHLPADASPAQIQPALVGLVPRDTGPPEDVKRRYFGADTELPVFSARHADDGAVSGDAVSDDDQDHQSDQSGVAPNEGETSEEGVDRDQED